MQTTPMEPNMDCCESLTLSRTSRRSLLLGGASFAAWAYLPKFARAAEQQRAARGRRGCPALTAIHVHAGLFH